VNARERRRFWLGAAALFLFALGYRVLLLRSTHFDGLYGQDAYAYFDYVAALRAALLRGEGPPPFHWPLGYPVLCFLVSLFTGPVAMAGQAAAVLSAAMCPVLVYWMALQCRRDAWVGAFLAGLMLGAAHYAMHMSLSYMSDLPGLMWALLAGNAMLAYTQGLRKRWLAVAALALAAALLTRWVYALMAVPLGLAALMAYFERRTPWRTVAAHAALAVLAGSGLLALHFAPSLLRQDEKFAYAGNLRTYSWSPANFFAREFESSDGRASWPTPPAAYYLSPLWDAKYVPPLLAPLLLAGMVALFRGVPRPARMLLVAWAGVFYLFFAGVYMQNPRFPLSYFSPLILTLALGLEWLAGQFGRRANAARAVLAVLFVACLMPGARQSLRDIHYTQTKVIPAEIAHAKWAASLTPRHLVLLAQGNSMILSHNVPHHVIDLFNLSDEERDAFLAANGEVYVMVDPAAVETQWAGRRPMAHLDWLRANTEFTEVGARGRYRLYRALAYTMP
jgi:hypothetical protein